MNTGVQVSALARHSGNLTASLLPSLIHSFQTLKLIITEKMTSGSAEESQKGLPGAAEESSQVGGVGGLLLQLRRETGVPGHWGPSTQVPEGLPENLGPVPSVMESGDRWERSCFYL